MCKITRWEVSMLSLWPHYQNWLLSTCICHLIRENNSFVMIWMCIEIQSWANYMLTSIHIFYLATKQIHLVTDGRKGGLLLFSDALGLKISHSRSGHTHYKFLLLAHNARYWSAHHTWQTRFFKVPSVQHWYTGFVVFSQFLGRQ